MLFGSVMIQAAVALATLVSAVAGPTAIESGEELLGRPAPAWSFDRWIGATPRSVEDLRGQVVLMRWWTDGCRYCKATLPVLEKLRLRYPDDLVVIGVYHPKVPKEVTDRDIANHARKLGFGGAIAVDSKWTTLGRYWLDGHPEHEWTSVSFLLDRRGRVRWIHPGGEYHPSDQSSHAECDRAMRELSRVLTEVIAEPATAGDVSDP